MDMLQPYFLTLQYDELNSLQFWICVDDSLLIAAAGASGGIGSETARVLALRGVHVIMGVRNMEAGGEVKESIIKENPRAKVDTMELDLSSLASVRKFAADYRSLDLPLNILM